jgi:iron complex transport system substrate-binding protein
MDRILLCLLAVLLVVSCKDRQSENKSSQRIPSTKYAKGFWVEDKGSYRDVFVRQSNDSTQATLHYRLVESGSPPAQQGVTIIQVPIKTIVCTSTTHIPLLDYLNEIDKLIGFTSTQYISSKKTRQRIDSGLVKELGIDNSINLELIAQLKPSLLMAYSLGNELGHLKKVQELGIPVIINAEYLEQHPLGRAEWIKFMALFFGKEKMADSIFNWIESEYLKAKSSNENLKQNPSDGQIKPTVLTGIPYGGIWYLPGGQNYAARFFEDAGCKYVWSDDPSTGFLQLSFETVYERASPADFWIGVGSFEKLSELKSSDDRFVKFSAWKNKRVYNYNARMGETGGNEYLELGYLRPDLILKDLIQITHPQQYPKPDLFFYRRLSK